MANTLWQLLPFLLAGMFLPTWTTYVTVLLGTDRPLSTASGYVLGNATWRMILGIVTLFIVQASAPSVARKGIYMPIWFAVLLSASLFFMGVWLIRRKPKATEGLGLPKWLVALKRLPPWASFGYGWWNCMMPGAQWVYFLSGMAVISASGLRSSEEFVVLVVYVALLETMLVTPIVIYARRREAATAVFDRLDKWLAVHATTVFGGILMMIGGFFAIVAFNGGKIG